MREGEREREGEVCQRGKTGGEEDGFSFSFFLFLKKVSRRNSPRQSSPLTPLINVILTCSFKNCLFAQSLVAVRNLQVHFPPSCFLPSFLFLFFFVRFIRTSVFNVVRNFSSSPSFLLFSVFLPSFIYLSFSLVSNYFFPFLTGVFQTEEKNWNFEVSFSFALKGFLLRKFHCFRINLRGII